MNVKPPLYRQRRFNRVADEYFIKCVIFETTTTTKLPTLFVRMYVLQLDIATQQMTQLIVQIYKKKYLKKHLKISDFK